MILDPVYEELFTAIDGQRAYCNGRVMQPSRCVSPNEALVACSFPAGIDRNAPEIAQFVSVLESCRSLRRLGSCALNMCYVADGRLDAYWATSVKSWDAAAGIVIARQAGATITACDGGELNQWVPKFCLSATAALNSEMTQLLSGPGV